MQFKKKLKSLNYEPMINKNIKLNYQPIKTIKKVSNITE